MSTYAVTVLGDDRPGIVAGITGALAQVGGNLEDSSMTILRGHFAMTLVVVAAAELSEVRAALAPVADRLAVTVAVNPVADEPPPAPTGPHHLLTVHGADRPGIVAAVTGLLAERGGNITDLTTRLAGGLYLLVCEVDLPETVDPAALAAELDALGARLGVSAALRPADDELL